MFRNMQATPTSTSSMLFPKVSSKFASNRISCNLKRISLSRAGGKAFMLLGTSRECTPSIHALSPNSLRPLSLKNKYRLQASTSQLADLQISARKLNIGVKFRA